MRIEAIAYSELRAFGGILPDYAEDFSRVAEYYAANPKSEGDLKRSAEAALGRAREREGLAGRLAEYNGRLGAGAETLANIERLRGDDCAAVVTGQQPGLLGGPMYTWWKALTAIRLARNLSEGGILCVPVFWNASDDHDASEYGAALMPGENGGVRRLADLPEGASAFDVGVTEECRGLLAEFRGALPETEFRDEVMEGIAKCYEGNLAEAFSRVMLRMLGRHGLVVMEPRLLRREAAGIIAREIETRGESSGAIRDAAERLKKAGYEAPFTGEEGLKVFVYEGGRRQRLVAEGGGFRTKERKYSTREILEMVERSPERFSPDAALRPIVQDAVLPTAAYVAGPTELAYLAQLKKVYEFFGVGMPAIYPRASATLVEGSMAKYLVNFGVSAKDFLNGSKAPEGVGNAEKDDRVERQFAELLAEIGKHLEELREMTVRYEPTLARPFEKVERNVRGELAKLKEKAVEAQMNRLGIGRRQWGRISRGLLPEGKLQERVETIVPWLCKYGAGLIDELSAELPLGEFRHFLIHV